VSYAPQHHVAAVGYGGELQVRVLPLQLSQQVLKQVRLKQHPGGGGERGRRMAGKEKQQQVRQMQGIKWG